MKLRQPLTQTPQPQMSTQSKPVQPLKQNVSQPKSKVPYVENGVLIIPEGITEIEDYAFENRTDFNSIRIPNSVTYIGREAFYGCTGLTSVIIPDSMTSISEEVFKNCSRLTSVTIPRSVTDIGYEAFSGCSELANIYYNGDIASWCGIDGLEYLMITRPINLYLGGNKVEGELVIPKNVKNIGACSFYGCTDITRVTIENGVTEIGEFAFGWCTELANVKIPDSVTIIGTFAFINCIKITSIIIPTNVTRICDCAFEECIGLTHITIPDSVTIIGMFAFKGCCNLKSMTIGSGIMYIYDNAFENCVKLTDISYRGTEKQWSLVKKETDWDLNTGKYSVTCLYKTSTSAVKSATQTAVQPKLSPQRKEPYVVDGTLVVLKGITRIKEDAFKNRRDLTSVIIPDSVTSIGSYAFYGCINLTTVTIGNGVANIGKNAFGMSDFYKIDYNNILKKIIYRGTKKQWSKVEKAKDWKEGRKHFLEIECTDGVVREW